MSAQQLVQDITWIVYIVIFLNVAIQAIRRPTSAHIDITLFFAACALIIAISTGRLLGLLPPDLPLTILTIALLLALPYCLLRLVDDFSFVPRWLKRSTGLVLALLIAAAVLYPAPYPGWLNLLMLAYLIGYLTYCAIAFLLGARQSRGVTRRRMIAIAVGTLLVMLIFLFAGFSLWLPAFADVAPILNGAVSLASGVSYYLGFSPPSFLRRAWQEPELRTFLGHAARLPRLPDTSAILRELEHGAAQSLGAPNARIGLWDSTDKVLRFSLADGTPFDLDVHSVTPSGKAFSTKRPVFVPHVKYDDPTLQAMNRTVGATAVMAAPISAGEQPLGVLTVYAPRSPIFAEDDLSLVQLLADQAAVILESRALIDEAARVRAREEATRLKDDFLSAAAHDLKTPLTTLIAQAQLMERRALRQPDAPADLKAIQRLVTEGQRLKSLVQELLDALRAEQGTLIGHREETDITAIAREICERHHTTLHPCIVEAAGAVRGLYDRNRLSQLIENLVENAVKYSPEGGNVRVTAQCEGKDAHLLVCDNGIGIPADDLPHVFDRFYRGQNVDDRRFAGMGLGLFICRGIVEQHGGRIWASRNQGQGTTIHVVLPLEIEGEPRGS